MNDDDVKKFKPNEKYKLWVNGMLMIKDLGLFGLVS
jgi:hypothetical protein